MFLARLLDRWRAGIGPWWTIASVAVLLYLPMMSMLLFEKDARFSFELVTTAYGTLTYTNAAYHANVLKFILSAPLEALTVSFQQGAGALLAGNTWSSNDQQRALLYVLAPLAFLLVFEATHFWFRRRRAAAHAERGASN